MHDEILETALVRFRSNECRIGPTGVLYAHCGRTHAIRRLRARYRCLPAPAPQTSAWRSSPKVAHLAETPQPLDHREHVLHSARTLDLLRFFARATSSISPPLRMR